MNKIIYALLIVSICFNIYFINGGLKELNEDTKVRAIADLIESQKLTQVQISELLMKIEKLETRQAVIDKVIGIK